MRFISKNSVLTLFFMTAIVVGAQAQEKEADAEAAKEAPKEAAKPEGESSDREWAKRTTKLNIYEAKISELNKKIQAMIKSKNNNTVALDDKGKPIDVLATISSSHSELKKTVQDYNQARGELKYRYPEEGARIERRYVPLRAQSIEQIEKEIGLDSELTVTKKKIDKKYEVFMREEQVAPEPKQQEMPESTLKDIKPKRHAEQPQRIKLSQ